MFATQKPRKRIESADKAIEDPTMQQAVSWSQSKKISEEANEELQSILAGLCESMKDERTVNEVKGTMQSFSGEMKQKLASKEKR